MESFNHLSTYSDESGHYIEGFLIGTKETQHLNPQERFRVSKKTIGKNVAKFLNKSFIIIPEKLVDGGIDGHIHGADKAATINAYQDYTHGTIEGIKGPYSYNDGTDDVYYKHVTKLKDSKSAALLVDIGEKLVLPFATSPHIWKEDDSPDLDIQDFDAVSISLVGKGAYGDISVINKICQGSPKSCNKSFGASQNKENKICPIELDKQTSILISSLVSKSASLESTNLSLNNSPSNTGNDAGNLSNLGNANKDTKELASEPKGDKITLTKEQYDKFNQDIEESKATKKQVLELTRINNTNVLNNIFKSDLITDGTKQEQFVKKYLEKSVNGADINLLGEFYNDLQVSIIPALIEKTKLDLENSYKAQAKDANDKALLDAKNKEGGKAASNLRQEPKDDSNKSNDGSDSKAAAAETKPINQVALLSELMNGNL